MTLLYPSDFILHPSSFILIRPFFPFLFNLFQQPIDALAFLFDPVTHEMYLGSARKIQGEAQLLTNVGRSVAQCAKSDSVFLFVAHYGDKNLRFTEVVGEPNISHGHHRQPRILQLVPNNLGNFLTKNVCNSLWATHE